MKNGILLVCAAGLICLAAAPAAASGPAAAADPESLARFAAAHIDRPGIPPFSFVYDGKPSSSFLGSWTATSSKRTEGERTFTTVVYADPGSGLRVTIVSTAYAGFPAAEWVVRFKNAGVSDTPVIEDVLAASVRFEDWPEGPATLHRALGSDAEKNDFGPIADPLAEGAAVVFGPPRGRSSETSALPFFNIAGAGRGVLAGVGWSGSWKATVRRTGPRALLLEAGMPKTHFRLRPGEEVRIPMISLLFWKSGDRLDGHNLFRRFVLAHHAPRPNGKLLVPPISIGIGFGGPVPCEEYVCATEGFALAAIDRLGQFGLDPDNFWIDAGWYAAPGRTWWTGAGTWSPETTRWPRGLKPVGEAIRARGKGFVLWFEPERAYEGTQLDLEHPEWLTRIPGNRNRLLDLGNPEALKWLTEKISGEIAAAGVTIYRQDFNMDPAPFWRLMDGPDRVGIAEMKHIEGLYAFWDALLAKFPGLLIDNCASGGRRIDMETIGRSVPLWRTDYTTSEPGGLQCHTYGLQLYVPFSGTGHGDPRKYKFRSAIGGGAVVTGWDPDAIQDFGPFPQSAAREAVAEFRALRPYFFGDYYPLTEYATADEAWMAFQWDRPDERDGIVMAFRRSQSVDAVSRLALRGLDPGADYEVDFTDYGLTEIRSGRELASGLSVKIPEPAGSLVIKYRRVR